MGPGINAGGITGQQADAAGADAVGGGAGTVTLDRRFYNGFDSVVGVDAGTTHAHTCGAATGEAYCGSPDCGLD